MHSYLYTNSFSTVGSIKSYEDLFLTVGKNNPETLTEEKDAQNPDQTQGEQHSGDIMANAQGEQPPAQELLNVEQAPLSMNKMLCQETKVLNSNIVINSLKSILTEPIQKPDATKITIEHKTTSSIFSSTSPRDPTPPKDESKWKDITNEEPLKEIMPFMEEGCSIPKITSLKSFVILEGKLTNEDVMAQVKEMKRLANLKAKKEKSEKSLQKIMNPATIRAQDQKMAPYKAKIKKMLDEYNHQISHTADQLPITKISYRVNSSKEATIRITKGNDPLNLTIYENFRLKTLRFSEWLEVHAEVSHQLPNHLP
ncbi:hypothetical protein Tco_0601589 [Tanacetum coccineum]